MRSWLGIVAFVGAYDAWAGLTDHPTLSREFADSVQTRPAVMAIGTAFLVAHLYGALPRRLDPLCIYVDILGGLPLRRRRRHIVIELP